MCVHRKRTKLFAKTLLKCRPRAWTVSVASASRPIYSTAMCPGALQ